MSALIRPGIVVASNGQMTVIALSANQMRAVVARWPKLQPVPAPQPFAEMVRGLDAVLAEARAANERQRAESIRQFEEWKASQPVAPDAPLKGVR